MLQLHKVLLAPGNHAGVACCKGKASGGAEVVVTNCVLEARRLEARVCTEPNAVDIGHCKTNFAKSMSSIGSANTSMGNKAISTTGSHVAIKMAPVTKIFAACAQTCVSVSSAENFSAIAGRL